MSFVWSGDTAGQGWGIDEARGGMRTYAAMRNNRPDFFIHSGDTIYADVPLQPEVKLPDGTLWKNLVTEEKSKPAETLAEFRGNFKYNLLDRNLLAFNAEVPMFAQWDDHEVSNNWWPGEDLTGAKHRRLRYSETNARCWRRAPAARFTNSCRSARSRPSPAASIARFPTARCSTCSCSTCGAIADRTARAARTSYGPPAYLFGPQQMAWLKRELQNSRAVWKVIAADQPLGLIIYEDFVRKWGAEAIGRDRRAAARPRARNRRPARFHQARGHPQHRLAHRRRALHRGALLRSEQGGVSGLRAVLGVRLRPDSRRLLRPRNELDNTFGPQLMYVKAPTDGAGREPVAGDRASSSSAMSRSTARRRDDGDAQGRRRPRAVVDADRAEDGLISKSRSRWWPAWRERRAERPVARPRRARPNRKRR